MYSILYYLYLITSLFSCASYFLAISSASGPVKSYNILNSVASNSYSKTFKVGFLSSSLLITAVDTSFCHA